MAAELAGSERPRPEPELSFCGARHRERGTANGEGAVNPDFAVAHWGLGETWRERTVRLAVPVRVDGVGFHDRTETLDWLQKVRDARSGWTPFLMVEPQFAWLAKDPDFLRLLSGVRR